MAKKMTTATEITQLKTNLWRAHGGRSIETEYETETDTFLLYFTNIKREDLIVTHYIDQFVFILFRHADNEVVGMGIEGFERAFAPSYADIGPWKLSQTGIQISGIKDLIFGVQAQIRESISFTPRATSIRLVKKQEQEYALSPEHVFSA